MTSIIHLKSLAPFTTFNRPSVEGTEIFHNQTFVILEQCYNGSGNYFKIASQIQTN